MSRNFVKLYGSILDSSVWAEDAETRLVWVTLLAMADENGHVEASPGGLARRANVSKAGCEAAIGKFLSPDPDSKSQDHEGRRIQAAPGGWDLLNHRRYRDMRTTTQIQTAERVRRHRERAVTLRNSKKALRNRKKPVIRTEAEVEVEVEVEKTETDFRLTPVDSKPVVAELVPVPPKTSWSTEAGDDHAACYGGIPNYEKIGKALKALVTKHGWDQVRPRWQNYLLKTEAQFVNPFRFAETFGSWGNGSVTAKTASMINAAHEAIQEIEARKP